MLAKIFERLLTLYEELEVYYLELADLESVYNTTGHEYQETLEAISNASSQIASFFEDVIALNLLDQLYWYVEQIIEEKEEPLLLGAGPFELFRLRNSLEGMVGDSNFDYISALKYDQAQLELLIIEALLKNPKYEGIRDYLIRYKYGIIYMRPNLETNMLDKVQDKEIELYSNQYRNRYLPSYSYLDEAVLIYPATSGLASLENIVEDFLGVSNESTTKAVITALKCLCSFILCDNRTIKKCQTELDFLQNSDMVHNDVKEVLEDINEVITKIAESIKWSR